ncbi:hypothetical protein PAXRUDRAFT_158877 [Paxillus rubicundulus Ve08.2h10]|uniref:G-patch domain-containing protein n=1 Tax=Paxillus rubicundulus Ve08.2h10 TaxID=930991 RepID=A0A0D0CC29_9AGAM|nr:hypothetical protein PAXRUDRAFT_158877 [Paxillus rubicundulus Ve08.2h10]
MSSHGQSYGHAYLKSYGWAGTGTGLRRGAIDKPLAVPPKKNLAGLGKDRDEAFPFWDHLFTAASKAITIKVSSDDENTDEDPSKPTASLSLKRTTTGIISNRPPISGTPAAASSSTTPDSDTPGAGTLKRLSLIAAAKREAARRGLYSRFFRGPVLDPDDGPSVGTTPASTPESSSVPTPASERVDGTTKVTETVRENKKRKSEDRTEKREERRERKRLKRERKAAKTLKKAKKAEAESVVDGSEDGRKARKRRDKAAKLASDEEHSTSLLPKKRKQDRESTEVVKGSHPAAARGMGKKSKKDVDVVDDQHEKGTTRTSHTPIGDKSSMDEPNTILTTKKQKSKRKET